MDEPCPKLQKAQLLVRMLDEKIAERRATRASKLKTFNEQLDKFNDIVLKQEKEEHDLATAAHRHLKTVTDALSSQAELAPRAPSAKKAKH